MSLDKKGFAEIVESAINECKKITEQNKSLVTSAYLSTSQDDISYKHNKYMKKLALSKIERLYSILSAPAYSRIISISDSGVETYRTDKIAELTSLLNRLMLAMEVSIDEVEKITIKTKIDSLIEEQNNLKEMTTEQVRKYVIDKLGLEIQSGDDSFDGEEETNVLQNIIKDHDSLTRFTSMVDEYRKLEKEIKEIRTEQIIIYNELINRNIKEDISIDELFDETTLESLQSRIAEKIQEINETESNLKKDFANKTKKTYYKIKSDEYKTLDVLPYEKGVLEMFESIIPSRTLELALLQNEEWVRLNKKVFKTTEVNNTLAILSMEIDDTKNLIDSFIRDWYKNAYYYNSLFGPVSSRASGKFEYSLGAKNCLEDFITLGVWPEESDIDSLKLCLKLNRIEAEKSIIYAEQIKEKLKRLFNSSLDRKKNELQDLDERITAKFGNWKNEVILSIINEIK